MAMKVTDIAEAVEEYLPYDGPHSRETVRDGSEALSAIVRYLNNATGPWGTGQRTLEWAATVNAVVGNVKAAVYGMDQLLGQLSEILEWHADNAEAGKLYDDRRRPEHPGDATAREAAALLEKSRAHVAGLASALQAANSLTHHLGND